MREMTTRTISFDDRGREMELKSGKPAICIPLTGENRGELAAELQLIKNQPCQLVEWRADKMIAAMKSKSVWSIMRELLNTLGFLNAELECPLLFTIRTAGEGGDADIIAEDYFFINRMVAGSKMAELIDVEAFVAPGSDMVSEFVKYAHSLKQKVLLSNHDFGKTPPVDEMVSKYECMNELEGDIIKLAVMPHDENDVAELLEAAAITNEEYPDKPLVAISMGEMGMISRICAGQFGSVITFAAGKNSSAPGQIKAEVLKEYLDKYYK